MTQRVCLHIGVAKTATTTLQREVFARHSGIAYLGKPFRHAGAEDGEGTESRLPAHIIRAVREQDASGYDEAKVRRDLDAALAAVERTAKPLVLSEEGLSSAVGGAGRRLIAERLRKLFGPSNVLITIRNQLTGLPSRYVHKLKKGTMREASFDRWLARSLASHQMAGDPDHWMIKQNRFFELYSLYKEVFFDGTVKVMLYEDLVDDRRAFCAGLSTFLDIDPEEALAHLLQAQRLNVGVSDAAARFADRYRRFKRGYAAMRETWFPAFSLRRFLPGASPALGGVYREFLDRLNRGQRGGEALRLSDDTRAALAAYYADDNRKLAAACELPLAENGYPV